MDRSRAPIDIGHWYRWDAIRYFTNSALPNYTRVQKLCDFIVIIYLKLVLHIDTTDVTDIDICPPMLVSIL